MYAGRAAIYPMWRTHLCNKLITGIRVICSSNHLSLANIKTLIPFPDFRSRATIRWQSIPYLLAYAYITKVAVAYPASHFMVIYSY
jgi:hypothetical protein